MDRRGVWNFWSAWSVGAQIGLASAAIVIVAFAAVAAWWALRDDYQPLFSELDPRDAAAITAELERAKVPYRLDEEGGAILVEKSAVHATRLKVMNKGLDLKGTVGFEIFNNTDFGMTEFAQKINYQRALQGELARTIGALEEVKSARVHLVLPESGLLRKSVVKPKASVTLVMRGVQRPQPEQIQGIQRLVAAAVPEMEPAAVTVLDQQGVALSRRGDAQSDGDAGSAALEAKREIESYLARKVAAVLDQAFGPGRAIVSVDVALNHDHVKVTREDVLPSGGVLRRKDSAQKPATDNARPSAANSSEVEYQLGRKVEQIVTSPGSIRRISVGVLLPPAIDEPQVEGLKQVIAMAAGLNMARGDALAFSWVSERVHDGVPQAKVEAPQRRVAPPPPLPSDAVPWIALALSAVIFVLLLYVYRRRGREAGLSPKQREEMLEQLRGWVARGAPRGGAQS
jgi:flagellar M-ring protein FliF